MNKLFVDLNGPYSMPIKGQKENLNLKAVTMIYPVTGWFEITQYNNRRWMLIVNLA